MGDFIGNIGAAFIVGTAIIVIAKLFCEIGIIKDSANLKKYGQISFVTVLIGGVYIALAAYMYNAAKGRTNIFEFDKIFAFFGMDSIYKACEKLTLKRMFSGMLMPLYPLIVNLTGKLVFEQYIPVAAFYSFMSTCVSACLLHSMLSKHLDRDSTENVLLFISILPCAFVFFAPIYIPMTLMFVLLGAYALLGDSKKGFAVSAALACLTSKLGVVIFLLLPLKKYAPLILRTLKNSVLKNKSALKILVTLFILINGAVMFCLIRGL